MKCPVSVLGVTGLVLLVTMLSACPEEEDRRQAPKRGTLSVKSIDNTGVEDNYLASDGTSYLTLQLQARDADGAAWSGAVNLSTDLGAFAAAQPTDSMDVTTDAEGQASVQFICGKPGSGEPEDPGEATITVRNSEAQAKLTLICDVVEDKREVILTAPSGSIIHYADGYREVVITAQVFGMSGDPEGGASVLFESASQSLISSSGSLSTQVRANTNSVGHVTVNVKAPTTPQSISIQASWEYNQSEEPKSDSVNINFAADSSDVTLDSDRQSAPADGSASIALTATAFDFDGQAMPEGTEVTFTVNEPYGFGSPATSSTTATVVGSDGIAQASLNATLTQGQAMVTAEFTVGTGQVRRSAPLSLEFVEPGQMLLLLTAEPPSIFTDDQELTVLTVKVERDGVVLDGQSVTFDLTLQDGALATFGLQGAISSLTSVTRTTNSDGEASTELRGFYPGAAGSIMVSATTIDAQNGNEETSVSEAVLLKRHPMLQSIVFLSALPAILGTRGSPRTSTSEVSFQALDDNNMPMADVNFQFLRPTDIDPTVVITTVGGGDTAVSDATGTVVAFLAAGVQAHPVRVIAEATDPRTGLKLTVTSDSIPIVSGLSSWSHSWFVCDGSGAALWPPAERSCTVELADRFSERVGAGSSVQFRVESGNIDPTAVTGDNGATGAVSYLTGTPFPADTPDLNGDLGTDNTTDMLINMLAYTRGEEPFTDLNGNGVYEVGEPFVDFPEPYVDKQDNCVRNDATDPTDQYYLDPSIYPGGMADPYVILKRTDPFVDGNNDGVWNGANGVWDDDSLIWFQEQTLWVYRFQNMQIVDTFCADSIIPFDQNYPELGNSRHMKYMQRCDIDNPLNPTKGHIAWVQMGDKITLRFRAVDHYGNCPAPGATASYSWAAENGEGSGTINVNKSGCGLNSGMMAVDSNTGHFLPYCTTFSNLDIDENLVVHGNGVGSHPEVANFETGTAVIGEPIKLTVTFQGDEPRDESMIYLVPCTSDEECGATPSSDDGGTSEPTGPTCQMETGLCVGGN